jgi:hypothetical protein
MNTLAEKRVARAKRMLDAKKVFDKFIFLWEVAYHVEFANKKFFGNAVRKKIMRVLWFENLEEIELRIKNFFRCEDSWLKKNKHPIFYFLKYHARFRKNSKRLDSGKFENGQKTNYRIADHENFDVEREIKKYYNRKIVG